jgi:hypothetical protein
MTLIDTPAPSARPIGDVIAIGDADLGDLDDRAVVEQARTNYARIRDHHSDAFAHYLGKIGYGTDGAHELTQLVYRFLALSAAWQGLGHTDILSLPERADNDGWHGLLIQTRDYAAVCEKLGTFIHHATTDGAQGVAVARTLALLSRTFGDIDDPAWADCAGCVIYGWCSSGTD